MNNNTTKTIDDILDSIPKPKDRKNKQFEIVFDEKYGSGLLNILLKRKDGFDFNVNSLLPEGWNIQLSENINHFGQCNCLRKTIYLSCINKSEDILLWVALHEIRHSWQNLGEVIETEYKKYTKSAKIPEKFEYELSDRFEFDQWVLYFMPNPKPKTLEGLDLTYKIISVIEKDANNHALKTLKKISKKGYSGIDYNAIEENIFRMYAQLEFNRVSAFYTKHGKSAIKDYRPIYFKEDIYVKITKLNKIELHTKNRLIISDDEDDMP